ncbi:MAG: PadR family transcriptional regulator [Vulcanimicrobiaceae bacterium]
MPGGADVKAPDSLELNATAASLLGYLAEGPRSGYDLASLIEKSIGYFWNVTRSQIYRELRALEEAGLVRAGKAGRRERRPFTRTATGRAAFDAWIAKMPADELIRFPLLLTVFFGDRLPVPELARILRDHRARHENRREEYRKVLAFLQGGDVDRAMAARTARFGLMYEEAVLEWFASLEREGLL